MTETIRIAMWSGPRNISTAMMRAWGSRADCTVMDEPFYGAYLVSTGLDHPMRDRIIASHATDWDEIAADCAGRAGAPVIYQKHMCQHMIAEAPTGWMEGLCHAFLIRPPAEVAASFKVKWDGMGADDLGFHRQAELFEHVAQLHGKAPPVIEARDVLENPEGILRALCAALEVPFDRAMLRWEPGLRETDGIWAAHWYESVNASSGFAPPRAPGPVPPGLEKIVEECQPAYEALAGVKLSPLTSG